MSEQKIEKFKFFGGKCYDLIGERFRTIIYIVELMIALLVIASFSEDIIPKSSHGSLKNLIIFLLSVIPIMLADYMLKINDGINALQSAAGLTTKGIKKNWHITLIDGSNYFYFFIVTIVIHIIIYLINQNFLTSIFIIIIQFCLISSIYYFKRKL